MTWQDTVALNQLAYRYAAAVDACDVAAFTGVFTPDGRLRSYYPGEETPFADLQGEHLAVVPNSMRTRYRNTAHMMCNHIVNVDGDTATGEVLCMARHLMADRSIKDSINVIIRYFDRYARVDGRWLIADRHIRFQWLERHPIAEQNEVG
jgi:hypothetical protein